MAVLPGNTQTAFRPYSALRAGAIARHQAHQPDRIGRAHDAAQRLVHPAGAQVGQRLGHHLDALGHRQQLLDLGVIQDENLHMSPHCL